MRAEEVFLAEQEHDGLEALSGFPYCLRDSQSLGAFAHPLWGPTLKSGLVWHKRAIFID